MTKPIGFVGALMIIEGIERNYPVVEEHRDNSVAERVKSVSCPDKYGRGGIMAPNISELRNNTIGLVRAKIPRLQLMGIRIHIFNLQDSTWKGSALRDPMLFPTFVRFCPTLVVLYSGWPSAPSETYCRTLRISSRNLVEWYDSNMGTQIISSVRKHRDTVTKFRELYPHGFTSHRVTLGQFTQFSQKMKKVLLSSWCGEIHWWWLTKVTWRQPNHCPWGPDIQGHLRSVPGFAGISITLQIDQGTPNRIWPLTLLQEMCPKMRASKNQDTTVVHGCFFVTFLCWASADFQRNSFIKCYPPQLFGFFDQHPAASIATFWVMPSLAHRCKHNVRIKSHEQGMLGYNMIQPCVWRRNKRKSNKVPRMKGSCNIFQGSWKWWISDFAPHELSTNHCVLPSHWLCVCIENNHFEGG